MDCSVVVICWCWCCCRGLRVLGVVNSRLVLFCVMGCWLSCWIS